MYLTVNLYLYKMASALQQTTGTLGSALLYMLCLF